jgi:hypothetical protein
MLCVDDAPELPQPVGAVFVRLLPFTDAPTSVVYLPARAPAIRIVGVILPLTVGPGLRHPSQRRKRGLIKYAKS